MSTDMCTAAASAAVIANAIAAAQPDFPTTNEGKNMERTEKPIRRFAAEIPDGDRHTWLTVDLVGMHGYGNANAELIAEALRRIAAEIEGEV
jgi:CubicO group peptidase (beta-lactamase class C family)